MNKVIVGDKDKEGKGERGSFFACLFYQKEA